MIAPHVADAVVLDLFAGTGALSLEAISRGASAAVLCEQSAPSQKLSGKTFQKRAFRRRVR